MDGLPHPISSTGGVTMKAPTRKDAMTPASRVVDAVDNGMKWAAFANLVKLAKVVFWFMGVKREQK